MDRMKTFGLYALCIILFFIFSNVMINIAIKTTYNPIGMDIILEENVKIDIRDAKATYVNGYVEGSVNNIGEDIERIYVKIDLYSKRNNHLGTKYVKIENFRKNESRDFRMGYKFTDVKYAKVQIVNEIPETVTEEEFTSVEFRFAKLLATVILLCFFG